MVDVLGNAVDVPIGVASQPSLSESQVLYLAQIAKKIEAHYQGVPQDIEWAISKDGYFRILQARPITTIKNPLQGSDSTLDSTPAVRWDDWMTTCNASEMFPGAGTPLTQSVFGFAIDYGMQALQVDFGIRHEIDGNEPATLLLVSPPFIY